MMRTWCVLLCLPLITWANEAPRNQCGHITDRPCVGLVLGGGGARGGAHIGVLEALESQGVPIDLVVGTSIGSFVGAMYASGKSAEEIQLIFAHANWDSGYQDSLPRSQIPNRRKRQLDDFPIHLDLGFDGHSVRLPQGVLQGQGMKDLIDQLVGTHATYESFDNLAIPFRAVAADITTGEQVVLSRGDLSTALQASMSIPGIVRPIEYQGHLLVDGGIANNLPISVARNLGADVIIAVDIGAANQSREELSSSINILKQLTNFLTHKNVAEQKATLTENDLYIHLQLDNIGMLDFDKVSAAAHEGYRQAHPMIANSKVLASLAELSEQSPQDRQLDPEHTLRLDRIRLVNHSRLGDDYILNRMDLREGQVYSSAEIHEGVERLYGQGTIARVRTTLSHDTGGNTLNTIVDEKEWGPGYMDFKISLEDDLESQSRYQLGMNYRRTNLSPYGAEWYSTVELGTEKILSTELYWPINTTRFFWELGARYDRDIYSYRNEGIGFGDIIETEFGILGALGYNVSDKLDIIAGPFFAEGELELPALLAQSTGAEQIDYRQQGVQINFDFDNLNHPSFPSRGWKYELNLTRSQFDLLGDSTDSTQVTSELIGAASYQRHSWRAELELNATLNDDPLAITGASSLGGFLKLSGNPPDFISGQHTRFASMVYTYRLADGNYRILNIPLYAGGSIEAGNAWVEQDKIDYADLIYSGSVFLGWDSPLGPAYLAWGKSDTGNQSAYIFMGVTF
ncbi:patatin-like phospholipase family protein [Gilvimarinus xylanilyticus]|uniref:Patatin-like phospholipase family protein n=1 Tax=Gilvimarinus xylanilyticus TaxID=2944139 RepID=A0A9X2KX42_9GAMM|nr:patatin-like phospholipase family protein [Gilvimarinus xylanilyticus]MCP8900675.1 patatin-like phospholipase family protein [Gilvimarinus xylanilyticus]